MLLSSVIQRRVVLMWTDVSEELITYIFTVENQSRKTTRRYILQDANIHLLNN
jgi:hypothetical protein